MARASFLSLDRDHLMAPDGGGLVRVVVRHTGAVAVLPLAGGSAVLIRQYRSAAGKTLLEIPAGKLDVDGEDPETTARRELEEEVGYRAGSLRRIASFYTSPGFVDEYMHLYFAEDLQPVLANPHGAEEEASEILHVPVDQLAGLISSGEIEDAKTLVALGLYLALE